MLFFVDIVDDVLKVIEQVLAVVYTGDYILPFDLFELGFQLFIVGMGS
mgnify:CR=1 FL=1